MYRFAVPFRALIESGVATGNVCFGPSPNPQLTPGSPLLVQAQQGLAPGIVTTAKKNQCRFVLDVDDLAWLIADRNTVYQQLHDADLVTASTEPLADELRKRGFDPSVVPTTIEPRDWSVQPRRVKRVRPRIGWYAQREVDADDMALVVEIARAVIDEADFVIFGHVPAGLSDPAGQVERHGPVPLSFFPALFAALDLDMVLAPLIRNARNDCHSNLTLLQAGVLGYPVLASDVAPHRTLPVARLPHNHAAWIAAIRDRMHDPAAARSEGETLRSAVCARFTIESSATRHLAIWTGASLAAIHG
jgi:hypothetical protein